MSKKVEVTFSSGEKHIVIVDDNINNVREYLSNYFEPALDNGWVSGDIISFVEVE